MIWKCYLMFDELNVISDNIMVVYLGIVYICLGDDVLEVEMLVDICIYQLFGLLYGGVLAVLVEMLGLMVGFMMICDGQCVVGIEFNVIYYCLVFEGKVCGVCQLLYFGW